jgi:hypothetical protein
VVSGFQDSTLGLPLELQAGVVDVVGSDLQVHRLAHLPRSQGRVGRGEHRHDLLVGRMIRQLGGRQRGRLGTGRLQQRLAGYPDLLGSAAEFVQPCGQLRDLLPRRLGLRGNLSSAYKEARCHPLRRAPPVV